MAVSRTKLLVWLAFCLAEATAITNYNNAPFSTESIEEWLKARCGAENDDDESAIWKYEGSLIDPLNGRRICGVQGMEMVRYMGDTGMANNGTTATTPKPTNTILSRKLFVYHDKDDRLLTSIRTRPGGPSRLIPFRQSVALYESATTVESRRNGTQLLCRSELPNGQCFWAKAEAMTSKRANGNNDNKSESSSKTWDFMLFTRKRTVPIPSEEEDNDASITPKRSRLIQFGIGPQQQDGKFGARETYSYVLESAPRRRLLSHWLRFRRQRPARSNCVVKYTRYGESPPWYGPGRYCLLELVGKRIHGLEEMPSLVASMAAQRVPGFLSATPPKAAATSLVSWIRQHPIQLNVDGEEDSDDTTTSWRQRLSKPFRKKKK